MKILMVLTSHDQLGDTGKKTGFWLEEFAASYYVFKEAGMEITLASPQGGEPPLDPESDEPDSRTAATKRFKQDRAAQTALATTLKLSDVSAAAFDALYSKADDWQPYVVSDGHLITGQNPASSEAAAITLLEFLGISPHR